MFGFFGHETCRILAFWSGIQPTPYDLEGEVSTTGLPGKSPHNNLLKYESDLDAFLFKTF